MLTIRMQRLGRKGHPTYRVVVQDVRQTPTSGKYVALLGSYDPHSKTNTLSREKAEFYLKNGAQPSDRVIRLFTSEGITLPDWVKMPSEHTREIRNPDKLRKNQPEEEKSAESASSEETAEASAEPAASDEEPSAEPAEEAADTADSPVAEEKADTEPSEPEAEKDEEKAPAEAAKK